MITETELKKKGRPQSEHYVKESELRDEIENAQKNKIKFLTSLANDWDKKISQLTVEQEKNTMILEKNKSLAEAETKTYCNNRLGQIVVLTVNRVATQTKFRHYTYLDDIVHLRFVLTFIHQGKRKFSSQNCFFVFHKNCHRIID